MYLNGIFLHCSAGNVDIVLNGGFGDFCEDPGESNAEDGAVFVTLTVSGSSNVIFEFIVRDYCFGNCMLAPRVSPIG